MFPSFSSEYVPHFVQVVLFSEVDLKLAPIANSEGHKIVVKADLHLIA